MDYPSPITLPHPAETLVWSRESILFSACNEDSRSELDALGTLTGKDIFCVTAGGGRVLALLLDGPASITAVDLNPAQNALLELKVAAMRAFEHDAYLRFLGVRPSHNRVETYERLREALSPSATRFFDANVRSIEAGILFQGRLERYLGLVSKVLRLAHPFGLGRLLSAETVEHQREMVDRWETPLWKALAHTVCRRSVLAALSGDPGFYQHLPPDLVLHEVLYDRILRHLRSNLLRDNPLLQLVFHGRYVWDPALPVYLNAENYDRIKKALGAVRLDIVTGTVHEVLAASSRRGHYDAFSLSDICSYLDLERHHSLFEHVLSSSAAGAKLCSRSNIYHRPLSVEHARQIDRNPALERRLARHDHACVHEFVVGTRL